MDKVSSILEEIGISRIAKKIGVRPSAVCRWRDEERLPLSDLTGFTNYSETIAAIVGNPEISVTLRFKTREAWERRPPRTGKKQAKKKAR